jgi:metal-sulfur cluster biosynthetic enzyme
MVLDVLARCYDPCCKEKQVSVVDMGLIEDIRIVRTQVDIAMILTSGWRPFAMHLLSKQRDGASAARPTSGHQRPDQRLGTDSDLAGYHQL